MLSSKFQADIPDIFEVFVLSGQDKNGNGN
jgi:hypothetical protein